MSNTNKPVVIRAKKGFRRLKAQDVLTESLHVFTAFFASTYFTVGTPAPAPAPPVDQATMKAANDTLQGAITAAATGARAAITAASHAKEAVVLILDQLVSYVQANSKGDMNAFMSSGFTPLPSAKTKTPPVSESIKKIVPGANSGEVDITLMKFPGASSYELRWGLSGAGGALPTAWTMVPVTTIKTPLTISNLTPATTYVFQARAVVNGGYSDYGDPIARIVV
jgi:hypothetical protein